ncbi:MAG TPA: hypothetical protein PLC98_25210 [Anaerolineales bacterium]|nr:hypothetical protein [Anaerolineales bacterium]
MYKYTTPHPIRISYGRLLTLSMIAHLLAAVPALGFSWLSLPILGLFEYLFLPMIVLSIPLAAAFALLWAKASEWKNTRFAALMVVMFPWRVYWNMTALITSGGVYRFLTSTTALSRTLCVIAAVVFVVLVYWGNSRLSNRFAKVILSRWAPDLSLDPRQETA